MIIELLLDLVYGLFELLTTPIDIPVLSDEVLSYFDTFLDYFGMGIGILSYFINWSYITLLFGIVMLVEVGVRLYYFVLWVLKKIPMLGIE